MTSLHKAQALHPFCATAAWQLLITAGCSVKRSEASASAILCRSQQTATKVLMIRTSSMLQLLVLARCQGWQQALPCCAQHISCNSNSSAKSYSFCCLSCITQVPDVLCLQQLMQQIMTPISSTCSCMQNIHDWQSCQDH